MQREIKFRAWDKAEHRMIYSGTEQNDYPFSWMIHIDGIDIAEHDGTDWNYLKDIIFMQYTGLKDKNGKEIYEGDIVRAEDGEIFTVKNGEHNTSEWNDTYELGFYVESNSEEEISRAIRTDIVFWVKYRKLETIGNIYENPELLTQSPKGTA